MADPAERETEAARGGVARVLDDLYEKIGRHHHGVSGHVAEPIPPPADAGATNGGFEVSIELPGIDKKDLEVTVSGGRLSVKGEKRQAKQRKGQHYHLEERCYGAFERVFTLPPGLDTDAIRATYVNGVLTVAIPRKKDAKRTVKKIAVKGRR